MPVPFAQIVTIKEVYDYAKGSAAAATTKCPGASADYDSLASEIQDFVQEELGGVWTEHAGVEQFKKAILRINEDCKAMTGSALQVPVQPKPGGAAPQPTPPLVKAGFPWWIVLLLGGGALAYYLATRKGKKNPWGAGS